MSILLTGAAGFIGSHVARALLDRGERVIAIDNLNDYYDVALKEARLAMLDAGSGFAFTRLDVADRDGIFRLVDNHRDLTDIIHLAAQAGVRHSLRDPYRYIDSNVMGTLVMLEAARRITPLRGMRLRVVLLGLRRQHQAAVERRRPRRSSGIALWSHQAQLRADRRSL